MQGYLADAQNALTRGWAWTLTQDPITWGLGTVVFLLLTVLLVLCGAMYYLSGRSPKRPSGMGTMRPDQEKKMNRTAAYYLSESLDQALVDKKLSVEEANYIRRRVGNILNTPSLLPRKVIDDVPLKEELTKKKIAVSAVVTGRKASPFDKYLATT